MSNSVAAVLLAEDDADLRGTLAWVFRRRGWVVEEVADGHGLKARLLAPGADFAVVVTDVHMPGPSGLAVLQEARARGKAVPFIVITSFGDVQTHAEAARLGARAVLDKPLDLLDLCARVEAALARAAG